MFWDKAAKYYDFFETIYNGKVYYSEGMLLQAQKNCKECIKKK